jgi:hypothetical protein
VSIDEALVTILVVVISLRFQWFPGGRRTMNAPDKRDSPRLALAVVLYLCFGMPVAAQVPAVVPVPDFTGPIPVTADSFPQMSVARMQTVVDLESLGYVEEEYFVSGTANVYDWEPDGSLSVRTPDAPYTSRILVRRPSDPGRSSGTVIVELVNNARRYDWPFLWPLSYESFADRGDVWVGVTHSPAAADALKMHDPVRYASLSFEDPLVDGVCANGREMGSSEEGLRWDIVSQVGALLKSDMPGRPLDGFEVEYVYGTTHFAELSTYVNAVHKYANLSDGSPVYDGYLIKSNDYPGRINQCGMAPPNGDPRQITRGVNVPVIRIIAQGDVLSTHTRRRDDSDLPGDRYRLYEVAGAPHMDTIYYQHMPVLEDQEVAGQIPYLWYWPLAYQCDPEINLLEFPVMRYATNAAFASLDLWVREGTPPPMASRIELVETGGEVEFGADSSGNGVGGVRSPYLDVPAATYHTKTGGRGTCQNLAWKEAFTWAELESRYGSSDAYNLLFAESVDRLVEERWLTPSDGERIKVERVRPPVPGR